MNANDRIRAAWQGLFAGDRIGGPTAMAFQLAQSLDDCGRFDASDVLQRYRAWYDREGFDTGQVAGLVLARLRTMDPAAAVIAVDADLEGMTAGCNPMHRALPLALALDEVPDDQLAACARAEAGLTHRHPLAAEASIAYLHIVRQLVRGAMDFNRTLAVAATGRPREIQSALLDSGDGSLDRGGYAPAVLRAALHFVRVAADSDSALAAAIAFAGPSNYCPVVAGPLAALRWCA